MAGPPRTGPKAPAEPRPGGGSVVATSPVATGRYGEGSPFWWELGFVYMNPHTGQTAPGAALVAPPTVALLGDWPEGAGQAVPLHGPRSAMLEMIGEAHVLVDLSVPELGDKPVEPLIWALQEAAERGVRVRVLADPSARSAALDGLRGRRGVEVRRAATNAAALIVDRGEACLAGEALRGDARRPELALLIRAPATLRAIEDVFERDWAEAGTIGGAVIVPPAGGYRLPESAVSTPEQTVDVESNRLALLPPSPPRGALPSEALWAQPALVSLLDSARSSARLRLSTVRGGALDAELSEALRRALERGVRVQVLVVDAAVSEADLRPLRALAGPGLELRREQRAAQAAPAAPEALSLVSIDGARVWLGSGGLGARSLSRERNVGLAVEGPALARMVERWFAAAWGADAKPLAMGE